MRTVTGLRLSKPFIKFLDNQAEENNQSRSQYMRELMIEGLIQRENENEARLPQDNEFDEEIV